MDAKRISALVASVIVAINSIMSMLGLPTLDIDESTVYQIVSAILLVVTWAYTIWLNFPFTAAAKEGQKVIDELKANKQK